jgi:hypothetical protein
VGAGEADVSLVLAVFSACIAPRSRQKEAQTRDDMCFFATVDVPLALAQPS